jgi:hypothetical protein
VTLAELTGERSYDQGVDYEQALGLTHALNNVFAALREAGVADGDILVDITGGQKVTSVAAAAVTSTGRRKSLTHSSSLVPAVRHLTNYGKGYGLPAG